MVDLVVKKLNLHKVNGALHARNNYKGSQTETSYPQSQFLIMTMDTETIGNGQATRITMR